MNLPALDQVARKEAWGRQRTQQQAGPTASGAATNDVGIAGLKVVFDSSANVYRLPISGVISFFLYFFFNCDFFFKCGLAIFSSLFLIH